MQKAFLTKEPIQLLRDSYLGVLIAATIVFAWISSLTGLFCLNITQTPVLVIIAAVFLRTFVHTGLFITTHEAIHGTIVPQNRLVNDTIGLVTSRLYALLPYKTLAQNHRLHHRYPASNQDPDFFGSGQSNPLLWYLNFMKKYLQGRQAWVLLIGMGIIFCILIWVLQLSPSNVLLFWVLPILLSSMQLFCFGIFLPHRLPESGWSDRHRARSSNYSAFWSFLACYHFDYHWEHHEYPNLPWYKLPSVRQMQQ